MAFVQFHLHYRVLCFADDIKLYDARVRSVDDRLKLWPESFCKCGSVYWVLLSINPSVEILLFLGSPIEWSYRLGEDNIR